ncbi:hypothetical protein, unlikely [Trypanosoma brucei brucei TREU927]|uniref:Uncharacterized protein n=1 Tax=Trypanosoma brucei brucei (strain 927/4 GUTat10.1) TaxID=185431 RepID=Q389G2_TRYB2|nr:hypothetical protein, unlikely [Trypanosoma brucei brucei TREU927]EAN78558.1 hypothetical protein, unlikely [Trypanosoma brucei brucei TREU927]
MHFSFCTSSKSLGMKNPTFSFFVVFFICAQEHHLHKRKRIQRQ